MSGLIPGEKLTCKVFIEADWKEENEERTLARPSFVLDENLCVLRCWDRQRGAVSDVIGQLSWPILSWMF